MTTEPRTEYLQGDALLPRIADFHARLRGFLASSQPLTLDLSGLGAVDVSFVQLMVSAALTAERAGQPLTLAGFSPKLRVAFEQAGVTVDPVAGRITLN